MCLYNPCRGSDRNWMPVTTGRKLLGPIHKKPAISVFSSSKAYGAEVMPAKCLFPRYLYLFIPFKILFLVLFFGFFCWTVQTWSINVYKKWVLQHILWAVSQNNPWSRANNLKFADHLREVVCCLDGGIETSVVTSLQLKQQRFKSFVGKREYWTSAVAAFAHKAIPHAIYDDSFVTIPAFWRAYCLQNKEKLSQIK